MTEQSNEEQTYKYAGIPLTPNVIAELAPVVMQSPMFRRAELVEAVHAHHLAHGGVPGAANVAQATKKALQALARDGLLEATGAYGLWRWITPPEPTSQSQLILGDLDDDAAEIDLSEGAVVEGEGSGSLYVYYFPSYKDLAELRSEERWPVKVGMTALGNAAIRISDQQGTAMPEEPTVAYVRKTDTPHRLERMVHSVLFYRSRQLEDAPGSEWFMSNPGEVKAIIDWAFGTHDV